MYDDLYSVVLLVNMALNGGDLEQGSHLGFLTWSTGPRNFQFCKIIESIWKRCGPEVPEWTKHESFQIFKLKLMQYLIDDHG